MGRSAASLLLHFVLFCCTNFLVTAQTGFLSIDCGATAAYVDNQTGIQWVPDGDYVYTGMNSNVSLQYQSYLREPLNTLRSFSGRSSASTDCYVLPIDVDQKYLLRATFLYGNYDGRNYWPSFYLSFDEGNWTHHIDSTGYLPNQTVTVELIFPPKQSDNVSLCFSSSNLRSDVPFISALELRPLPTTFYSLVPTAYLRLRLREYFNSDENAVIRYPQDPYDRLWVPNTYIPPNVTRTSFNATNRSSRFGNQLPIEVLTTALEGRNMSGFNYTVDLGLVNSRLLINCYFVDVRSNKTSTDLRGFNITLISSTGVRTSYLTFTFNSSESGRTGFFWGNWGASNHDIMTISLIPTTDSIMPPILNAYEIFSYEEPAAFPFSPPSPPPSSPPPPSPRPPSPPPPLPTPSPPPRKNSAPPSPSIMCFTRYFILAILLGGLV